MKISDIINNIQYDMLLKDKLINYVFNHYKDNIKKVPINFYQFMTYNIKGKNLIFIGTFIKQIENSDEIIVMYVFLEKYLNYRNISDNNYVPIVFSCYELIYFNTYQYTNTIEQNINILTNSINYNKLSMLLKNK